MTVHGDVFDSRERLCNPLAADLRSNFRWFQYRFPQLLALATTVIKSCSALFLLRRRCNRLLYVALCAIPRHLPDTSADSPFCLSTLQMSDSRPNCQTTHFCLTEHPARFTAGHLGAAEVLPASCARCRSGSASAPSAPTAQNTPSEAELTPVTSAVRHLRCMTTDLRLKPQLGPYKWAVSNLAERDRRSWMSDTSKSVRHPKNSTFTKFKISCYGQRSLQRRKLWMVLVRR